MATIQKIQKKPEIKSKIFAALEKINGEKLPECLKKILFLSGFNTFTSLEGMGANEIIEIEAFVNGNQDILNEIKCCGQEYAHNSNHFQFLPGHKVIIMNIPEQVKRIKSSKSNSKPTPQQIPDQDLKNQVINNLIKYMAKHGFELPEGILSERNILDFERTVNGFDAKCRFSCPFCAKTHDRGGSLCYMLKKKKIRLKRHLRSKGYSPHALSAFTVSFQSAFTTDAEIQHFFSISFFHLFFYYFSICHILNSLDGAINKCTQL